MAQVDFAYDSFPEVSGTALQDHVPTSGGSWILHSTSAGNAVISDDERLRGDVATDAVYYHSATPPVADYGVEAIAYEFTETASIIGVCARMDTTADTYYLFQAEERNFGLPDAWKLYKCVTGTFTQLGSTYYNAAGEIPATTSTLFSLGCSGTTITAYINGVAVITVTDSDIASAGKAGLRTFNTSTNSTGIHMEAWRAFHEAQTYETPALDIQTIHTAPTYTAVSAGLSYESSELTITTNVGATSFTGLPEWTNVAATQTYETPQLIIDLATGPPEYTVGSTTDGDGQHPLHWLNNHDWGDPGVNVTYETPALPIVVSAPSPEWSRDLHESYTTGTLLVSITQIAPQYIVVEQGASVTYETPGLVITLTSPLPEYSLVIAPVPVLGVLFGTDGYAANRIVGTIGDSLRITGEAGRAE